MQQTGLVLHSRHHMLLPKSDKLLTVLSLQTEAVMEHLRVQRLKT